MLGCVILLTGINAQASYQALGVATMRMKWLLLSLAVVYGWLTPGVPAFDASWAPSMPGLLLAIHRILGLLILLYMVKLLLAILSQQALVQGIYTLLWPLQKLGVSTQVFAVRVALTLRIVGEAQQLITESRQQDEKQGKMPALIDTASNVLCRVEQRAERVGDNDDVIIEAIAYPIWQLLIPLGFGLALTAGKVW